MSEYKIIYKKDFYHNYVYDVSASKDFSWKIGNLSSYWFQVKGCCKTTYGSGSCPPIQTDDQNCGKSSSQFVQTILAYTPQEVCQELIKSKWNWDICGMQKWSRPAENEYVSAADECNYLQDVDFRSVADCLSLTKNYSVNVNIKFISSVSYLKCGTGNCYS